MGVLELPSPARPTLSRNRLADVQITDGASLMPGLPKSAIAYPIGSDASDAESILAHLNGLVEYFRQSIFIRNFTVGLLTEDVPNDDKPAMARKVVSFVRERMKFTEDPQGVELIISPVSLLEDISAQGFAWGDCDDHTLLLASMLQSIGIDCRIIAVRLYSTKYFDHVINRITIHGQSWDVDPCWKEVNQPAYLHVLL